MVKYRIAHNVEAPTPQRSRRLKWDVPLEDLKPGAVMTLYMDPREAKDRVHAFRSFVDRQQKRTGILYSVYLSDQGIEVFIRRTGPDYPRPPLGENEDG